MAEPYEDEILEYLKGFPGGSSGKESAWNAGDLGSIPGLGRSPGKGNGNPLQYSGEFHGQRSLTSYSPWGLKESDMTESQEVGHFHFRISGKISSHAFKFKWEMQIRAERGAISSCLWKIKESCESNHSLFLSWPLCCHYHIFYSSICWKSQTLLLLFILNCQLSYKNI